MPEWTPGGRRAREMKRSNDGITVTLHSLTGFGKLGADQSWPVSQYGVLAQLT
jgi:hypothetical protein